MLIRLCVLLGALLLWSSPLTTAVEPPVQAANEAACNSLGAACVCSHTFQTAFVVVGTTGPGYDVAHESDTAGKRCGDALVSGLANFPVSTGRYAFISAPAGLPSGIHAFELSNPSGGGIKLQSTAISTGVVAENMTGRVGIRQYVYYSGTYQSTNYESGTCTNDKQVRIGDYVTAYNTGFSHSNFLGAWPPGPEQLRGKWVRLEYYTGNHQNTTSYDIYWKNITDNGPEYHQTIAARIGTYSATNKCDGPELGEPGYNPSNCHYPSNKQPWVIDGYREGSCAGYRRYAYAMMANWPNSAGQRIPVAQEIEGGILPPPPPVDTIAPTTPGSLAAVGGSLSVSLTHTASTDANSPITYIRERCSGAGCSNFAVVSTGTGTSFTSAGLAASTSYSFRVKAQDPSGNTSGYSNTATATTNSASAGGSFGSNATGQFVLNGTQTFGLFTSYFDSVNWRTADLDYLATNGFNGIRSWATWNVGVYGAARSVCDAAGALQTTQRNTVQAMIDYAKTKNMIVELVILDAGAGALMATDVARLACITNVVNYYKPTSAQANWNVFFDVENEHNDPAGTWGNTAAEMKTYTDTALAAWPGGLIAASCTNGDGSAFCGPSDSTSAIGATGLANINTKIVTNSERFLAVHENRSTNWWSVTGARVAAYRAYLASLGRSSIPVFFSEPNRRDAGTGNTAAEFLTAATDAKASGAAAWTFHHNKAFDLATTAMTAQFDSTETTIATTLANALVTAPGSGTTPTALAGGSDTFTRANSTELGTGWDQPFTAHVSAQIVSNKIRALNTTSGNGGESIELYVGAALVYPNNQGATIELATVSGVVKQYGRVMVRHAGIPTVSGYACEFSTNPSTAQIRKKTADAGADLTTLTTLSTPWVAGDVIGCFASGSTIYMTRGSVTSTPILSVTDTTYSTGKAGVYLYTATSPVANWEFDNFQIYEYTTPPPPCTPSITSASVDATGATVGWPSTCPPTQVRIRWDSGSIIEPISAFVLTGSTYRYTKVGGWTPGTSFECFDAMDAQGVPNIIDYVCAGYQAVYDQTVPTMTNTTVTPLPQGSTSGVVSLSLDKVSSCKYDTSDTTYALMANSMTTSSLSASATVSGLSAGTFVYYGRCNFTDVLGVEHPNLTSLVMTIVVDASTADTTVPSTVAGLVGAAISESQIQLNWTAATDNVLVSSYQTYSCSEDTCATPVLNGLPTALTQIITNVAPGSTSFFCVKAIDSSNNMSAACSNVATVTTPAILDITPPSDMTNLRLIIAFDLSVMLAFDQGTDNLGSVSSNIEQCSGAACTNFALVPPGGIQGTTLLTTLQANTLYRFRGKHCDFATPQNCSVNYSNILGVTTNATGLGAPLHQPRRAVFLERLPRN